MGVEFSYERFQQVFTEVSSKKTEKNLLGIKMATDGPAAVLVNNYSYDELLTSLKQLTKKVDNVAKISTVIEEMADKLCKVARVKSRRMW